MSQSYRFRHTNEIAGGFVLLTLALLIAGIYAAGHAHGWFEKKLIFRARFTTAEGTYGLQEGAEVRVIGILAGRVGEIVPSQPGGLETTFILKRKFSKFIRTDSIAKVKKQFAVAGDAYVEITLGSDDKVILPSGSAIKCVQDVELIEMAKKLLDDFQAAAVPMLNEFRGILTHVNGVAKQLEEKQGTAGRLIGDPALADEVQGIVKDIRATTTQLPVMAARLDAVMTNVEAVSTSLRTTASSFPAISSTVGGAVQDVRVVTGGLTGEVANVQAVLLQAESALRETQRLIEGLQKHWLVRKYMEEEETTRMVSPAPLPVGAGGGR